MGVQLGLHDYRKSHKVKPSMFVFLCLNSRLCCYFNCRDFTKPKRSLPYNFSKLTPCIFK